MVHGNASCMRLGAYLFIIPTIALGADQPLMSMAILIKRCGKDHVEYTCVCCIMPTGAAARYTSSRRRISTKRHFDALQSEEERLQYFEERVDIIRDDPQDAS
jgi:hypothetical protein